MIHIANGKNLNISDVRKGDTIVGRFGNPVKVVRTGDTFDLDCPDHGLFTVSKNRVGKKCPKCPRKANGKNFVAKAKQKFGDMYDYTKVKYKDSKTKVVIVCKVHGPFTQEPRIHLTGKGCLECGRLNQAKLLSFTEEDIKRRKIKQKKKKKLERKVLWRNLEKKLTKLNQDYTYEVMPVRKGRFRTFAEVKVRCKVHNVSFVASVVGLLKGHTYCPECKAHKKKIRSIKKALIRNELRRKERAKLKSESHKRKHETRLRRAELFKQEFLKKMQEKHPELDYSRFKYVNKNVAGLASCPKHGEFLATPGRHIRSKNPCYECEKEHQSKVTTKSTRHFIKLGKSVFGDRYDYSKTIYTGKKNPVIITCKEHGDFSVIAANHMHNKTNYGGCPKCRTTTAKKFGGELDKKVANYVKRLGYKVKSKDRRTIKPYEIDVMVPEKQFGVEIHGEYWHSTRFKNKNYHSMKAAMAEDAGIVLYQFWYREILDSPNIVKSMLRSALGKTNPVYARKTEIRQVPTTDRKIFFINNHLQGDARASVAYGLYEGETLVACMSFGKPRFNLKYEWEIIRFANTLNKTVVGGASKLWSHFIKAHKPKNVLTYADRRYSTGNLYKKLGFELSGVTSPNYFWHNKSGEIIHRYESQKHKLRKLLGKDFKAELSEVANMESTSRYRVYDAGSYRLIWTRGL